MFIWTQRCHESRQRASFFFFRWKVLEPVLRQKTRLWIGISRLVSCEISGALQPSIASLSLARIASRSILTFFPFFFFSLSLFHSNFCLKLLLLCLSPLFSLSLCLSRLSLSSAVPLWETIIDQLPSLSNWFPLSLRLSSPLSRRSPAVSSPLHSFQFAELHHFPQFLSFSLSLFFFLPFLTSLLSFTPSTLAQIPLYPLNWIHTRTKLECRHTHTALLPVRALSDPELDAQNLTLTAFAEFFRSP